MAGLHRASRSEPSWRQTSGNGFYGTPDGYGHAQRLSQGAPTAEAPETYDDTDDWLQRTLRAAHPSNPAWTPSDTDAQDRHQRRTDAGLPYRLPAPEPHPRRWSTAEFVAFLNKRHPHTGGGLCGCGEPTTVCPIRYGLDKLQPPDTRYTPA